MVDEHLEEEHAAPLRTTPQGTQAVAVGPGEVGYEERDTNFWNIIGWLAGLAVTVILTLVVVRFAFDQWFKWAARSDAPTSPILTRTQCSPEPRILPNLYDNANRPDEILQAAPESLPGEREREKEEQKKLGLLDGKDGLPVARRGRREGAGEGGKGQTASPPAVPARGGERRARRPARNPPPHAPTPAAARRRRTACDEGDVAAWAAW